jgi:glycoside/pentoside/hexuronide:cation symporter, GPH family
MPKVHYSLGRKILINLVPVGATVIMVIVNSSFMKFFTDVIGLSPAMYGTVFLLFSIWNGINDPILGYWADRKPITKKGKYAPLIRWATPVIAISVIALLFSSPSWSQIMIAAYLLVLLVIYEGAQTVLQVSFQAFSVNTFLSMQERTQVNVIMNYINMIPVFIAGMIPIWFLTGDFSQKTLILIFSAAILFGVILIAVGNMFIKEDPDFYKNMEVTNGLKQMFKLAKDLFLDRTFLLFMVAFFFLQASTGSYFTGYLYYMDNVLEVSGLRATIPDLLTGIAQMLIFPMIIVMVKKFGSRDTLWMGISMAIVGHIILFFPVNYWIAAATYIVILSGYAFSSAINIPFTGLVVDHIEMKTGKRQPGVVRGVMQVILIPAASVQTLILSALLDISGYVPGSKSQPEEVVRAIRIGTGLVPAIILIIAVILIRLIPINRTKEREIEAFVDKKHGDHN